jgi:Asp/Glu/hydantoin racemase
MKVRGGLPFYGHVAGILMLDSTTPRAPGDRGHAATFSFPVLYEVVQGFTLDQVRAPQPERLGPIVEAARRLEARGVNFVAADCGLFALYQQEIAAELQVPFLSSSLSLVPLVAAMLGPTRKVGIISGHAGILTDLHLRAAGIDMERATVVGMEGCREFVEAVLGDRLVLDTEAMAEGVVDAAEQLLIREPSVGAFVLECTNLVTFRRNLLERFGLPVFDLVTLIEMFADACRLRSFSAEYVRPRG